MSVHESCHVEPVEHASDVELSSRMATVAYDSACTSVSELIHAVEQAGVGTRHEYRAVLVS